MFSLRPSVLLQNVYCERVSDSCPFCFLFLFFQALCFQISSCGYEDTYSDHFFHLRPGFKFPVVVLTGRGHDHQWLHSRCSDGW